MKKIILFLLVLFALNVNAQGLVSGKSFEYSKLTTAQRDALTPDLNNVWIIFNQTNDQFEWYNGATWVALDTVLSKAQIEALGIDAGSLTGNLVDARLSSNVTLKNTVNIFTNENYFNNGLNVVDRISLTDLSSSILIGENAGLALAQNSSNKFNVAIGKDALKSNVNGLRSIAIGYQSLLNNTSSDNIALGYEALKTSVSGSSNIAIGFTSLHASTGFKNIGIGDLSLERVSFGNDNTSLGYSSLRYLTTGTNNVSLGSLSGNLLADKTTTNTLSDNSIFIGYNTSPLLNNQTNQIVIGHNANGSGSNTVTIGNNSIIGTYLKGVVYGNGSGINSLNASNLSSGIVPDIRLSSNVAFLNGSQTYSGVKDFTSSLNDIFNLRRTNWDSGDKYKFILSGTSGGETLSIFWRDDSSALESVRFQIRQDKLISPLLHDFQDGIDVKGTFSAKIAMTDVDEAVTGNITFDGNADEFSLDKDLGASSNLIYAQRLYASNGVSVSQPYTFSTLPVGALQGTICYITDASSVSYRADAVGGGSDFALVVYTGFKWIYH